MTVCPADRLLFVLYASGKYNFYTFLKLPHLQKLHNSGIAKTLYLEKQRDTATCWNVCKEKEVGRKFVHYPDGKVIDTVSGRGCYYLIYWPYSIYAYNTSSAACFYCSEWY